MHPDHFDLRSLRILGSVGEPINSAAWEWYHRHVGGGHCPIVDTFWQTETGGHVITPLPGATSLVPGSCTVPLSVRIAPTSSARRSPTNSRNGAEWCDERA
jgi:acetyl-CoA synthetase